MSYRGHYRNWTGFVCTLICFTSIYLSNVSLGSSLLVSVPDRELPVGQNNSNGVDLDSLYYFPLVY
jgi:hypothetical protein